MLSQLHYVHQGAEKCKLCVQSSVFWANINRDIDEMVKSCAPCQRHLAQNIKEPLLPHDEPPRAWHTLGSDLFFGITTTTFLCRITSANSLLLGSSRTSSATMIMHMKKMFEEHGVPEVLKTDNGKQYFFRDFQQFAKEYGFTHIKSSPHVVPKAMSPSKISLCRSNWLSVPPKRLDF